MEIKIANKLISRNQPVFIVAELGLNHNGSMALAEKMIRAAKQCGVDAVKMQFFVTKDFIGDKKLTYTHRSQGKTVTESQYEMFKRNELSQSQQRRLFAFAKKIGIILFSTPVDNSFKTIDYLSGKEINMPAIKIPSDDLTNLPMLSYYARKKRPMIISTGMATLDEVKNAVKAIKKQGNNEIIILKCTSLYPTPPEQANLCQIETLQKKFKNCLIGFSDHTQGRPAAVIAAANGAVLIEKHFTLDHNLPGPDHWYAADPKELAALVSEVRRAEKMFGNPKFVLSKAEMEIKAIARRSVIAAQSISRGQRITARDLEIKRPGTGLPPKYLQKFIGKFAKNNYHQGYIFTKKDL